MTIVMVRVEKDPATVWTGAVAAHLRPYVSTPPVHPKQGVGWSRLLTRLSFVLLPICFVLAGCGGGQGNGGPVAVTSADGLTRSLTTSNGIRVSLSVDKSTIKTGDDLTWTFTITNTTNAPISYISQPFVDEPEEIIGLLSGATITNTTNGGQLVDTLGGIGLPAGTTSVAASTTSAAESTLAPGASLTNTETLTGTQFGQGQEYIFTPPGIYKTSVVLGTICPTVEFTGPKVTVTN